MAKAGWLGANALADEASKRQGAYAETFMVDGTMERDDLGRQLPVGLGLLQQYE
jgi:hypothetical protein